MALCLQKGLEGALLDRGTRTSTHRTRCCVRALFGASQADTCSSVIMSPAKASRRRSWAVLGCGEKSPRYPVRFRTWAGTRKLLQTGRGNGTPAISSRWAREGREAGEEKQWLGPVSWPPQDVVGGVDGKWAEASALPLDCDSGKSLPCREPFMLTWNSHTE